jgi:hypothetical protein
MCVSKEFGQGRDPVDKFRVALADDHREVIATVRAILRDQFHENRDFIAAALSARGTGYVTKRRLSTDLVFAIHEALKAQLRRRRPGNADGVRCPGSWKCS